MTTDTTIEEKCQAFIKSMQDLREKKGMSKAELAEITGLKRPNIYRIETGIYKPNLETIMRIADALNADLELK